MEILLSCSYADIPAAEKAKDGLKLAKVDAEVTTCAINLTKLIGVVLTSKSQKQSLLNENPWIKKEFAHEGKINLRVMPFIVYSSSIEKLDDVWNKIEGIYEELFSEEFKPLAYDLDNLALSNEEFLRILQLYYLK